MKSTIPIPFPIPFPVPLPNGRSEAVRTMKPQRRKGRKGSAKLWFEPSQATGAGVARRSGRSRVTQCDASRPLGGLRVLAVSSCLPERIIVPEKPPGLE
jgi:hypothetical protein